MKLDESLVDIQPEEIAMLNRPDNFRKQLSAQDTKDSMDIPIVVKYDYVDLENEKYGFQQKFELRDTQEYFSKMKEISSNTINNLIEKAKKSERTGDRYHFYRSEFTGELRTAVKRLLPNADENMIVYHFGLYECESRQASPITGERSPRVYFMLGNNGHIYILFFDPFHELNPQVKH